LEEVLRGARAFLSYSSGESRQRAEQARAMMARTTLQLVLLPRCPAFRALALLSLVALRHDVRGQSASVDAGLLSIQGLGFVLFGHVSAR
jgi:hypothetical protein